MWPVPFFFSSIAWCLKMSSLQLIDDHWRPAKRSSEALKAQGYSQEQLNRIGRLFIDRFDKQQLSNASSTFTNMVRSSEAGHNVKQPCTKATEMILANRAKDNQNKSKVGAVKAKEIKATKGEKGAMTQEQAMAWYNSRG